MLKNSGLFKKCIALICSVAILLCAIPAFSVSAEETEKEVDFVLDFESEYIDSQGGIYYSDAYAENWVAANNRGSHTQIVTETDGNTAVRLTYDTENSNENYNANPLINIYNPSTMSRFRGTDGKKYIITFSYKIEETDGKTLELYIAPSNRWGGVNPDNKTTAFLDADMGPKAIVPYTHTAYIPVRGNITEKTDGYVTVSAVYTASETLTGTLGTFEAYPTILLQTNGKTKDDTHTGDRAYASVLIDNIRVSDYAVDYTLDFEETYLLADEQAYYNSANAENWSASNNRGSHAQFVTETDGNTAVRLTYDTQNSNENYNANAVMNIYDPTSRAKFMGETGKKYIISFSYKVEETDNKELQLYIAPSNRWGAVNPSNNAYAFFNTDMGPKAVVNNKTTEFTVVGEKITASGDVYKTVSATYIAQGPIESSSGNAFNSYPIIILQTNGKTKDTTHTGGRAYASVLIDNISVKEAGFADYCLDFEQEYRDSSNAVYYDSAAVNMTSDSARASHAEIVTEADGNTAVRLTYDNGRAENYKDNCAIKIYDPNVLSTFNGTSGVRYTISFSYKVENTDSRNMQFYIANCSRKTLSDTDANLNNLAMQANEFGYTAVGDIITQQTNGYVTVSEQFVANGLDYPIILLSTNGSTTVSDHNGTDFASVLIDNISVKKDRQYYKKFYNYNGSDVLVKVYDTDTFADLGIPTRAGYLFGGWYKDSAYTKKAQDSEIVNDCAEIYVKWLGDGTAISPAEITDAIAIGDIKGVNSGNISYGFTALECVRNSTIEQVASSVVCANDSDSWYGTFVISGGQTVTDYDETLGMSKIGLSISPESNSVIFYAEIPDFEAVGAEWSLGIKGVTLVQNNTTYNATLSGDENAFYYLEKGSKEWAVSDILKTGGVLCLPSGFKGYIRLDLSAIAFDAAVDYASAYTLDSLCLSFNAAGGEIRFGGIFYAPYDNGFETVININDTFYELSGDANAVVVNPYSAYNGNGEFSTRYSGTAGETGAELTTVQTSALWAESPIGVTSVSGEQLTTAGYMNTYRMQKMKVLMQPGTDAFMVYIELPEYKSNMCAVKILSPTLLSSDTESVINFSNSIYKYLDVNDGAWKTARAGSDGELYALTSGFKGYLKFDIKQMKGFDAIMGIDLSKPYYLENIEIAFNNIGGNGGNLVIGAVYAVLSDSDSVCIKNGISGEKLCAIAIGGDMDMDGGLSANDIVVMKKALLGFEISHAAKLRQNADGNNVFDIRDLIRVKKFAAGIAAPVVGDTTDGITYKNIFTPDVYTANTPTVYNRWSVQEYAAVIEADTALNSQQKAVDFANEINNNMVADFEKSGIDKMCHVSTFIYKNGNIYMSYYANTQSAAEDPRYQVARLAYCPENETDKMVILDVQAVGDDLYGQKVVGVYDTIIMEKKDDNDNLYVLWTANINGQYYRLWRTFNIHTQQFGPIGVNRFKVGNVTNDFSTSGIKNALTANNIGYKDMFMDIGVMQKLSTRVENGETYYYTGAYSGNFTCIIKSRDLITWEYVAQPNEGANGTGFVNETEWENAVYVVGDKCYYYVRQWPAVYDSNGNRTSGSEYGILTYYDLATGEWATPVLVGECQSRSDFIMYNNELYLFYAPTDRNHIGILKINTENLADTEVVLQADMQGSCFYPFVQYNSNGELCMSYTVNRTDIRLAKFTLSKYI